MRVRERKEKVERVGWLLVVVILILYYVYTIREKIIMIVLP